MEDSPRRGSAPAASTLDESPSSRSEQLIQKYRHSVDVSADILRSIEEVGAALWVLRGGVICLFICSFLMCVGGGDAFILWRLKCMAIFRIG